MWTPRDFPNLLIKLLSKVYFEPATSCMPCKRATVAPGARFLNYAGETKIILPPRSSIVPIFALSSPSSSSSAFSITTFMCASKDTILPLMFVFPFNLIITCCPRTLFSKSNGLSCVIYYTNKMIINRGSSFYNLQSRKSKIYTIRFYRLPAKQQIKIHKYLMGCIDL